MLPVLPVETACKVALNHDQVNEMKQQILNLAIALACGTIMCSGPSSSAQDLGSLGKQAQNLGGMNSLSGLAQKLNLSPQQLQQVMPILQKEVPQLQSIAGKPDLSKEQKVEQTKAVQKQSDSKLKSMLSPEQFTSLQSFRSAQLQDVLKGVVPH